MDQPKSRIHSIGNAPDEHIADLLKRREQELSQQIAALRGLLTPKEEELAKVHLAMSAIGLRAEVLASQCGLNLGTYVPSGNGPIAQVAASAVAALDQAELTIKQMILSALRDHFADGATPSELSDYMQTVYGKTVNRNSISPQLARLRALGAVAGGGSFDVKWKITRAGKMYDHPSSFADNDDATPTVEMGNYGPYPWDNSETTGEKPKQKSLIERLSEAEDIPRKED